MEVFHCINKRRSVRKYLDKPVEWGKLMDILDAGRMAPSAGNLQNWKFIVCANPAKKEEVARACVDQLWISHAPVLIIVCEEPKHSESLFGQRATRLYNIQNCAAAAENMLLAATALGLGSSWIGAFDEEKVKDIFSASADIRPQVIITIGYADEEPPMPDKLNLETIVYFEKWKSTLHDVAAIFGEYGLKIRTAFGSSKDLMNKWLGVLKEKSSEHSKKIKEKIKKSKTKDL